MYTFGITGNGQKEFYKGMEEIVTDSPFPIESEFLLKIVNGYSQVDMGSPVFYSIIVEKLLARGIEELSVSQICALAKSLKKATNV